MTTCTGHYFSVLSIVVVAGTLQKTVELATGNANHTIIPKSACIKRRVVVIGSRLANIFRFSENFSGAISPAML